MIKFDISKLPRELLEKMYKDVKSKEHLLEANKRPRKRRKGA